MELPKINKLNVFKRMFVLFIRSLKVDANCLICWVPLLNLVTFRVQIPELVTKKIKWGIIGKSRNIRYSMQRFSVPLK